MRFRPGLPVARFVRLLSKLRQIRRNPQGNSMMLMPTIRGETNVRDEAAQRTKPDGVGTLWRSWRIAASSGFGNYGESCPSYRVWVRFAESVGSFSDSGWDVEDEQPL